MKAERLIELLQKVSPDAEVMCFISTDDPARLSNITLAEFNALKNYEIFCVLRMEDDVDYCRLLIKNGGY